MPSRRILFATIGSLGDLHPCMALALELKQRGHIVTIAAAEFYRHRVQSVGLYFRPMRPHWDPTDANLIRPFENLKTGPERLFRDLILPQMPAAYTDLLAAAADADLLLAGELVYAAPLVAEKLGLPWVSLILSPSSFLSAYDPSLLPNVPALYRLRRGGWRINRFVLNLGGLSIRHWWRPIHRLRAEQGLAPTRDPFTEDKFSPYLTLALFSSRFAQPQPDWPASVVQPGFAFYDRSPAETPQPIEVTRFLEAGEPPIVFTLGSTAAHSPGHFYQVSAEAARQCGRRAILLGPPHSVTSELLSLPYAAFSTLFPCAAAIVHQGGSGTTGQAMRAGRPMLIVPFAWDQPDNGARIERLGAGLCLPRLRYTAASATAAIHRLLTDPVMADRAQQLSRAICQEDGTQSACNAIETIT